MSTGFAAMFNTHRDKAGQPMVTCDGLPQAQALAPRGELPHLLIERRQHVGMQASKSRYGIPGQGKNDASRLGPKPEWFSRLLSHAVKVAVKTQFSQRFGDKIFFTARDPATDNQHGVVFDLARETIFTQLGFVR